MARSSSLMAGSRAVPEGDALKIVAECRKCLEEEAERLAPRTHMRMLAVQRAMEAADGLPGGFGLKAINDQIRQLAKGVEEVPPAAVKAARRADLSATPEHCRSFFTSYISGKTGDVNKRRFNTYVRTACKRLGLDYIAVIGGSPDGQYAYYYLKYARDETGQCEPLVSCERLTAIIAESAMLLARRGWGAGEVGQMYRRARAVGEEIAMVDDPVIDRLRFEVAIGLWSHHLVRGDLEAAGAEAANLGEIAGQGDDQSMRVVALRAAGTTALWLGRLAAAERDLRKCLEELGDGSGYRPFASDLGASPFSLVASDLAGALVVLGRHAQALETGRRAREYLAGRNDPFHDCYSLAFSSWIKLEIGDRAGAAADASDLVRQASLCGLAALRGLGTALDGIVRAFLADDPKDGVGDVYRGLGEWQASGSALFVSSLLTKAAKVWLKAGNARQAEQALKEAFEFAKTGDGFYVAEMHRVRGDIQWMCSNDFAGAETDLRQALEISGAQQSRTYRLRAATSLLRLAQARDDLSREQKAQEIAGRATLLSEVCTSFTGEPDSADLQAARSLIAGSEQPRRPSPTDDGPLDGRRRPRRKG